MFVSNDEKDKALDDLHQLPRAVFTIPDKLDRITNRLDRLNDTLERIADALEDIAIEVQRPHEDAMERQHRQREQYAKRTFDTISSGRGRGE
jgi:predicted  nucleic acid-binding Zn-ribbon protein